MKEDKTASTPEFNIEDYPLEDYTTSKGEDKTRRVVPDDIFEEHLKELPIGTINESRNKIASCGGYLKPFGSDPEADKEIRRAGGEAVQAKLKQRRTFKEQVDILLNSKDNNGKTCLENIISAMYDRSQAGDVKAAAFLRDTAGEKPADTLDVNADIMTEADKAFLQMMKDLHHNI